MSCAMRDCPEGLTEDILGPRPCGRALGLLIALLLAGYLLFAHGCHGDEDNELLTSARGGVSAAPPSASVAAAAESPAAGA
jgi:hypothetical protein